MKNETTPSGEVSGCLRVETPGKYVNKPVLFRLNSWDAVPELGTVRGYRLEIHSDGKAVNIETRLLVQRERTPHTPEVRPEDVHILKPSRVKAFREILQFIKPKEANQ